MITKEQVQHIASLARLKLTEQEIEKFQKDLSSILEYFEVLNSLQSDGFAIVLRFNRHPDIEDVVSAFDPYIDFSVAPRLLAHLHWSWRRPEYLTREDTAAKANSELVQELLDAAPSQDQGFLQVKEVFSDEE